MSITTARQLNAGRQAELAQLSPAEPAWQAAALTSPVVLDTGHDDRRLVARLSGDTHLLLEIGAPELDLVLRFRGHALMQALEALHHPAIIDLTPGIRSLQIHYQPDRLSQCELLAIISEQWQSVISLDDLRVPSRVVYLPLSWDDPACQLAIDKYMTTVRRDAPWCPSNLEFIRRINDLPDIEAVFNTVFAANYLVMGLGDVYLGAPVATPLDPRHRLVTTKYNPARTWTAENSVGIGGAYLCVYGMEGPGAISLSGVHCRCGTATGRWPTLAVSPGYCASLTRSGFTRCRRKSCCAFVVISRWDAIRYALSTPSWRCQTISSSWRKRPAASAVIDSISSQRLTPSVNAG